MKINDIDLVEKVIIIRKMKNKKVKCLPLGQKLEAIIVEYLSIDNRSQDDYLIYSRKTGKGLNKRGLSLSIRKYNLKRGVMKTSVHLIRHNFACSFLKNGGSKDDLQDHLCHETREMTERYSKNYIPNLTQNYEKTNPLEIFYSEVVRPKTYTSIKLRN